MTDERTPSARPLLLTVLGDLVLPSGGRAWLGALTEGDGGTRTSLPARPVRRCDGWSARTSSSPSGTAGSPATCSPRPGRRRLEEAADRIYLRRSSTWDGAGGC
jgi:hypothetical protein